MRSVDQYAMHVTCPRCGALPGKPCMTIPLRGHRRHPVKRVHMPRIDAANTAADRLTAP